MNPSPSAPPKHERITAFVESLSIDSSLGVDSRYAGYFLCFHAGDYYEAHDVLENLWLSCRDSNRSFYQGLIQLAGAFVHLRKHHQFPSHPKHHFRLRPASRLFLMARERLLPFPLQHLGLDCGRVAAQCLAWHDAIAASDFTVNPWSPERLPKLPIDWVPGNSDSPAAVNMASRTL
jgi:hypothetical protein